MRSGSPRRPGSDAIRHHLGQLLAVEARLLASKRSVGDGLGGLLPRALAEHYRLSRLLSRVERPSGPRDIERLDRALRYHRARVRDLLRALRSPLAPAGPARDSPRAPGSAARVDAWPEQWLG